MGCRRHADAPRDHRPAVDFADTPAGGATGAPGKDAIVCIAPRIRARSTLVPFPYRMTPCLQCLPPC